MATTAASLALDPRGLEKLRSQAGSSPEKAIRDVSKQFETLFVNMLLKSMREATPKDGMFDSEQTRMYTGMLDQQLAQSMSARGIGLAEVMARQLSKGGENGVGVDLRSGLPSTRTIDSNPSSAGGPVSLIEALAAARVRAKATVAPSPPEAPKGASAGVRSFIDKMWPHAVQASRATGIPPQFILGQAALESGWGRREIKFADGASTHNVFGIKATGNWSGGSADTTTHEFVNGIKQKVVDKFRSYASYAESFMDYANLLKNNPRYSAVLEASDAKAFAQGLQRAGYATDPAYAAKLQRIITGSIMREGLAS